MQGAGSQLCKRRNSVQQHMHSIFNFQREQGEGQQNQRWCNASRWWQKQGGRESPTIHGR